MSKRPPFTEQRRAWRTAVCENPDCRQEFLTQNVAQVFCTANCMYRHHSRRYAWRERAAAGKPPTHLQRLLARLEEATGA